MLCQCRFHLDRLDAEAADLDLIVGAAHEFQQALRIPPHHIAGAVQPAAAEGRTDRPRIASRSARTGRDIPAPAAQPPHTIRLERPPGPVATTNPARTHVYSRPAAPIGTVRQRVGHGERRHVDGRLGRPVEVVDTDALAAARNASTSPPQECRRRCRPAVNDSEGAVRHGAARWSTRADSSSEASRTWFVTERAGPVG